MKRIFRRKLRKNPTGRSRDYAGKMGYADAASEEPSFLLTLTKNPAHLIEVKEIGRSAVGGSFHAAAFLPRKERSASDQVVAEDANAAVW